MSNNIAIKAEGLSKLYRIGERQAAYKTIRESIMKGATAPFRKAAGILRGQAYSAAGLKEEIWALKDVTFEVGHGEVLGIIGRNGAGKTTLLKILSRITEPTEGTAELYGRVSSLLEVGTGMHPELTGRENVFLNGTILGMKRAEIKNKFDEIVDFSGVERFIDTPLKHYSTGMQVRLAFSIAAHLEPEILMVDEVLAVGDAEFQKKCMGKMSDVARGGRTVLFVSHNMAAVRRLCTSGMRLENGAIVDLGDVDQVVTDYLNDTSLADISSAASPMRHFNDLSVSVSSMTGGPVLPLEDAKISVRFSGKNDIMSGQAYIGVYSPDDYLLFGIDFLDMAESPVQAKAGQMMEYEFDIEGLPLYPGDYFLRVHLKDMGNDIIEPSDDRFPFSVQEGAPLKTNLGRQWRGDLAVEAEAAGRVIDGDAAVEDEAS